MKSILLAVIMAVVGAVLGAFTGVVTGYYYSKTLTKEYASSAIVKRESSTGKRTSYLAASHKMTDVELASEFELILSSKITTAVVERLKLTERWGVELSTARQRLGQQILLRPYRNTHLIEITAITEDSDLSALIVNTLTEEYLNDTNQQKRAASNRDIEALKAELVRQKAEVESAQQAVDLAVAQGPDALEQAKRQLQTQRSLLEIISARYKQEVVDQHLVKDVAVIVNKAEPALRPFSPNVGLNTVLGGVTGAMAGTFLALMGFLLIKVVFKGFSKAE